MKITILDDDHDTARTFGCFANPAGHEVTIWNAKPKVHRPWRGAKRRLEGRTVPIPAKFASA